MIKIQLLWKSMIRNISFFWPTSMTCYCFIQYISNPFTFVHPFWGLVFGNTTHKCSVHDFFFIIISTFFYWCLKWVVPIIIAHWFVILCLCISEWYGCSSCYRLPLWACPWCRVYGMSELIKFLRDIIEIQGGWFFFFNFLLWVAIIMQSSPLWTLVNCLYLWEIVYLESKLIIFIFFLWFWTIFPML